MIKTIWKVDIVTPKELEELLNNGWYLEKMQGVMEVRLGQPASKILVVLSKQKDEE